MPTYHLAYISNTRPIISGFKFTSEQYKEEFQTINYHQLK